MKIAVKYCGGCNPYYDRVGIVAALQQEFPEVEFVSAGAFDGTEEPDKALIVCGCAAACADHGGITAKYGTTVPTSLADFEKIRVKIREILAAKEG